MGKCMNCGYEAPAPEAKPQAWMGHHLSDLCHVAGCGCQYCAPRDAAIAQKRAASRVKAAQAKQDKQVKNR